MAVNKFMHPRNIYKTPPDFRELAKTYSEFSSISKMDITGKVSIDFKDPKALRILTKCLLKSDFNLDIEIPEDRLVPTLPLRLNYILWIEDILGSVKMENDIFGIDIGTGACAIYPVLAATKNKWKMIGTETDDESLQRAKENIEKNKLQSFVYLKKNPTKTIIAHVLDSEPEQLFEFCMCNPPFYSSVQELCGSRNPTRPLPKNGFTGSPQELITEGGELNFCRKLIEESKANSNRVKIFTTMVGHKHSLQELLTNLTADKIKFTHTEFCQGHVTRWGLAWTFQEYDIHNLVPSRQKERKKSSSLTYLLPQVPDSVYNVETCVEKIKGILYELDINCKFINKIGQVINMQITANNNTWSHQRRKRRLLKRLETENAKKLKCNEIGSADPSNTAEDACELITNNNCTYLNDKKHSTLEESGRNPIVQALMKVFRKKQNILFEVELLSGSAGKEGLHQIVQYIKNMWK